MEKTSRVTRKSLSLGSLKHSKRKSASPQSRLRGVQSIASSNVVDLSTPGGPCSSSSVMSASSDCGIQFTPPHKKISFDDSLDYSPHSLDCSFSPSGMLSQTLSNQSPEVSWRWNRAQCGIVEEAAAAIPDSACAADSSYMSAGSSSTEVLNLAHASGESQLHRVTLANHRQERRRAIEQQKRKAEKLKMDEMLKRRCAKLQKQLKEGQKNSLSQKEKQFNELKSEADAKQSCGTNLSTSQVQTHSIKALQSIPRSAARTVAVDSNTHDSMDDFFNDTESDGLLLQATQQLESKIGVEMTQKSVIACNDKNSLNSAEPASVITTPKSSHKEKKRSSFYSKFLEDDSADDWFVALDDAALQAIQNVKPRTSLQRYKSMPADTMPNTRTEMFNDQKVACTDTKSTLKIKDEVTSTNKGSARSFKRHVSSHSVSPSSTSCKLSQKHLRSRIES